MARYIDVSEIKFTGFTFDDINKNVYVYLSDVRQAIEQTPTADVVEVKHGEWKLVNTEKYMDDSYYSKFFCSKCLREVGVCHTYESDKYEFAKTMYPYCHCGAKMDVSKMEITTEEGAEQ